MSARALVTDDPYATATRLLQVGAGLSMVQAGTLLSGRDYEAVVAFAAQADSADSAAAVINRLVDTAMNELVRLGIHGIVSDLFWKHIGLRGVDSRADR